jgi:hypothetical protein
VSSAGTVTRGDFRPREAGQPRRLVLLSESAGLAAVLTCLLDPKDRLTRTVWSDDAAGHRRLADADLVVLDVPRDARAAAFEQLRRSYRGPVVVLVDRGDNGRGLPPDKGRTLLARPFSTDNLRAALHLGLAEAPTPPRPAPAAPAPSRPAPAAQAGRRPPAPAGPAPRPGAPGTRPGGPGTRPGGPQARTGATTAPAVGAGVAPAALAGKAASMVAPPAGSAEVASLFQAPGDRANAGQSGILSVDGKAAARVAPPRPGAAGPPPATGRRGRLAALLAGLVHGWRGRRAVRIATFAGVAAVAFLGAFGLAAQGRCGPGCDDLKGIAPVTTLPAADASLAPTTTPRRQPPSTTTATPGSGYRGAPAGVVGSTTSTTRRATTTTRASSGTTRSTSPVTKPPTTSPPPTPTPTTPPPTPTPTPTPPPPST